MLHILSKIRAAGTELQGQNLVASRASKCKKLLALTQIHWPPIMQRNALVDVMCLSEQKQLLSNKTSLFMHFTCKTSLKDYLGWTHKFVNYRVAIKQQRKIINLDQKWMTLWSANMM